MPYKSVFVDEYKICQLGKKCYLCVAVAERSGTVERFD